MNQAIGKEVKRAFMELQYRFIFFFRIHVYRAVDIMV